MGGASKRRDSVFFGFFSGTASLYLESGALGNFTCIPLYRSIWLQLSKVGNSGSGIGGSKEGRQGLWGKRCTCRHFD